MKVLITGAGGMVGGAVAKHCAGCGDEIFAHDHQSLDIADEKIIETIFKREHPDVVINCAAWTDVDACESNPQKAYEVNAQAVEILAKESRRINALLITISTDYVFDGSKEGFYTQRDDPNPASVYGAAKLDGEIRARTASARVIVVRTGWIFGAGGRNFLSQVIERAQSGAPLKAISDAYGTPTYAPDLARRLRELAALDLPGIYHIANSGAGASFYEFTHAALSAAGFESPSVERIRADSLKRPAPRPQNTRLRCLISEALGLAPLQDWKSALQHFVSNAP